ncbi:phosphodiesterase [Sphingomonas sp. AP4-R1]|uniref:alkaline phosphatase D family protein n=1 Tax=Sphingomonas sp. AP4-R1 TaxID=2735134 RepID=UPI001493C9EF|nr:alkaline phosphatase D family protein [Sphingomonas sp. AP4-R1]QJU58873.1 phosphodiesterase [Sphingomonas sp. AP4-R1]
MADFDRRSVLGAVSAGSLMLAAGAGARPRQFSVFTHGVASGDPHADSLLLWTRAMGPGGAAVEGRWQVATDRSFRRIVSEGDFATSAERDHVAKIVADGLRPGTEYWYRFRTAHDVSPTGRARTLPTGGTEKLDIALACCAMYMLGEFHAYRAIAERTDLDLVLFVGDYIYEYGANSFPTAPDIRVPVPTHDTVTLADYRARYAAWRADPALQAAHARAPWICMWDDHEIANDDWMGGAQHHDPAKQGPWEDRKTAAVRAYLEWMPIRDPDPAHPYAVQRSFSFGDLATLILPETRLEARDAQLTLPHDLKVRMMDHADPAHPVPVTDPTILATLDPKALPARYRMEPDIAAFRAKLADPARRMVGDEQLDWIRRETEASVAKRQPWLLFGSPTIMGRYVYPDLDALVPAASKARFEALQPGASALYRMTGLGLPLFNLDSWDGYPAERQRVYDIFEKSGANVVVLSGDSHMAWLNELHDGERRVAVEVSTSTLTGPSMGSMLLFDEAAVGQHFVDENRDVAWCDHVAVGFVAVRVTRQGVEAEFVDIPGPRRAAFEARPGKRARAALTERGVGGWTDA